MEWAGEFGPPPPEVLFQDGRNRIAIHLDQYSPSYFSDQHLLHVRYRIIPMDYGVRIDGDVIRAAQEAILTQWFPVGERVTDLLRRRSQTSARDEAQRAELAARIREAIESGRLAPSDQAPEGWLGELGVELRELRHTYGHAEDVQPLSVQEMYDAVSRFNRLFQRRPFQSGFTKESEERAYALLLRLLSREQREMYERKRYFQAIGHKTRHLYRVKHDRQINVQDVTAGHRLCYVCPDVPLYDQLAAQKLLIEGDEDHFLAVARRW